MSTEQSPKTTRTPHFRYLTRFSIGMVLYIVTLFIAIAIRNEGIGTWQPGLLTLPSVAIIAWAVIAYYRESDEFVQRKLGESFIVGFAIGVPVVLVLGLLETFGGPHINGMVSFGVLMTGWLIGSIVAGIRYR
ncbi:hypothetical protein QBL02_02010 [Leucobacter sp. UT-8R-CII-1-4]|uniref:hypothetical protein n=1 Tax=Leucobacter sp. UT-8R-CII-1-4 TaxID=3040075 RepID=UPI0024A9AFC1|nr:hypothetical protein [Leucobacter sp. UT-8R-CII-1-4]MDI6022317.1 hypothetical protein [Leucobacter sp. UT-8R-CII-1-4]